MTRVQFRQQKPCAHGTHHPILVLTVQCHAVGQTMKQRCSRRNCCLCIAGEPLPPMEGDEVPRTIVSPPTDDTTFTGGQGVTLVASPGAEQRAPTPAKSPPPPPPPPPPSEFVPIKDGASGWNAFEVGSGIRDWCSQPFSSSNAPETLNTLADVGVLDEDMDLSD